MTVRPVDPRDTNWELPEPHYRVYFWNENANTCREFEVSDADDVTQVLNVGSRGR